MVGSFLLTDTPSLPPVYSHHLHDVENLANETPYL